MKRQIRVPHRGISLLLEVVFGLALFSIALLMIFGVFPTSHRSLTQAKNIAQANAVARQYMELEKAKNYAQVIADSPTTDSLEQRTSVVNGVTATTDYNVDVIAGPVLTTAAVDGYDSAWLTVTVRWSEGLIDRRVELATVVVQY